MTETILSILAQGPTRIAYLGNSITAQRAGYREKLHAMLQDHSRHRHRAINAGFGGVGAMASLCTMDRMVARHRPHICFIECLTGDIGVGWHALGGAAVEAIVTKLRAIGATPVLLLLPREGMAAREALELADLYRRVAVHHGVLQIDLHHRWDDLGPLLRDGVHTTPEGADIFARAICDGLDRPLPAAGAAPRLFSPDLSSAAEVSPAPHMRGRQADGLFRLQLPYWTLAAQEKLDLVLPGQSLLGLLLIQGPHAGTIAINGRAHDLRDRWSHYERLHAHVLAEPLGPGDPITIEALEGELRLSAFLTYCS